MQVGQLGISNIYDLEALQAIFQQARVKPAVVQNR
jgi:diketogulonate reductase-like aldo/keto reductase